MNKKIFLSTLLLLALQMPNSVVAMEEATDFTWSDKQAESQKDRNGIWENIKDWRLEGKEADRSIDAKREKLRQAISKGDVEGAKKWSKAFKPEEIHHVKLASKFAEDKASKETDSVEKRNAIKEHLAELFKNEKTSPRDTATPESKGNTAGQSPRVTPDEPSVGSRPATPRDTATSKSKGNTDLMNAIENDNGAFALKLLRDNPEKINAKNSKGETALMLAAKKGDVATLTALLALKGPDGKPIVDVNAQDNNGNTALMQAVRSGSDLLASALFNVKGIDVNVKNSQEETILVIAAEKGNLDIVNKVFKQQNRDIQELNKIINNKKTSPIDKKTSDEKLKTINRSNTEQYKKAIRKAIDSTNPDIDTIDILRSKLDNENFLTSDQKSKLTKIENQAKSNNQLRDALQEVIDAKKQGKTVSDALAKEITELDANKAKVSDPTLQAELKEFKSKEIRRQKHLDSQLALEVGDRKPDINRIRELEAEGATIDPEDTYLTNRLADFKKSLSKLRK